MNPKASLDNTALSDQIPGIAGQFYSNNSQYCFGGSSPQLEIINFQIENCWLCSVV